jgi:tetratricopeptide (TPR) repeat protein
VAHADLLRTYRLAQDALRSALLAAGAPLSHGPTIGGNREELVREALRVQLSAVSIKHGQIIAPAHDPSSEWDVVICDAAAPSTLAGVATIIPIESVLAVVSVKSMLDTAAIAECATAARALRGMQIQPLPSRPTPSVFAFGVDGVGSDTLATALRTASEEHGAAGRIDGALVLGKRTALRDDSGYVLQEGEDTYAQFIAVLDAAVRQAPRRAVNLLPYVSDLDTDEDQGPPSGSVLSPTPPPPSGPSGVSLRLDERPAAPELSASRVLRRVVDELAVEDPSGADLLASALTGGLPAVRALAQQATDRLLEATARVLSICDEHADAAALFLRAADQPGVDRAANVARAAGNLRANGEADRAEDLLSGLAGTPAADHPAVRLAWIPLEPDPATRIAMLDAIQTPDDPSLASFALVMRAEALSLLDRDAEIVDAMREMFETRWSIEVAERLAVLLLRSPRTGEGDGRGDEIASILDDVIHELLLLGLTSLAMMLDSRLVMALAQSGRFDLVRGIVDWWLPHADAIDADARVAFATALLDALEPAAARAFAPAELPTTFAGRLLGARLVLDEATQPEPAAEAISAAVAELDALLSESHGTSADANAVAQARGLAAAAGRASWSEPAADVLSQNPLYRDALRARHLLVSDGVEAAEAALLSYTDTPDGIRALMDIAEDSGRWDRVVGLVDEGLGGKARPVDLFRRALALAQLGRFEEAEHESLTVAALPQTSAFLAERAWSRAAELLSDRRQWERLSDVAQQWHQARPESPIALWVAADALAHIGQADDAWALITESGQQPRSSTERKLVAMVAANALALPDALARIAELSDASGRDDEYLESLLITLSVGEDKTELSPDLEARVKQTFADFPERFPDSTVLRSFKAPTTEQELAEFAERHLAGRRSAAIELERAVATGESALAVLALLGGTSLSVWLESNLLPLVAPVAAFIEQDAEDATAALAGPVVWDSSALATISLLDDKTRATLVKALPASIMPRAVEAEVKDLPRFVAEYDPERGAGHLTIDEGQPVIIEHSTERHVALAARAASIAEVVARLVTHDPDVSADDEVAEALRTDELHGSAASWLGAILLAAQRKRPLYCDDRYIRAWARRMGIPSFGTPALLDAVTGRDLLSREIRDSALWTLRDAGGRHLPPSLEGLFDRIAARNFEPDPDTVRLFHEPDGWLADATNEAGRCHELLFNIWRARPDALFPWFVQMVHGIASALDSRHENAANILVLSALAGREPEPGVSYFRDLRRAIRRCNLEAFAVGDPIGAVVARLEFGLVDVAPSQRFIFTLRAFSRLPLGEQMRILGTPE